jgi:hypothetical protein
MSNAITPALYEAYEEAGKKGLSPENKKQIQDNLASIIDLVDETLDLLEGGGEKKPPVEKEPVEKLPPIPEPEGEGEIKGGELEVEKSKPESIGY